MIKFFLRLFTNFVFVFLKSPFIYTSNIAKILLNKSHIKDLFFDFVATVFYLWFLILLSKIFLFA